jgi:hypothetical protein
MPHVKDVEHLDNESGTGFCEIDILVPYGFESRCYFGIEAKKVNTRSPSGKWESQAGEYVGRNGMGCFIDGRYACFQSEGAMVAYVMDGDCESARSSISDSIERQAEYLRLPIPCPQYAVPYLPEYSEAFETRHQLDRGEFKIFHILLPA